MGCLRRHKINLNLCWSLHYKRGHKMHLIMWWPCQRGQKIHLKMYWPYHSHPSEDTKSILTYVDQTTHMQEWTKNVSQHVLKKTTYASKSRKFINKCVRINLPLFSTVVPAVNKCVDQNHPMPTRNKKLSQNPPLPGRTTKCISSCVY